MRRKGDPCYAVAESLATLSPPVVQKIQDMPDELSAVAKISRPRAEGAAWFLLIVKRREINYRQGY